MPPDLLVAGDRLAIPGHGIDGQEVAADAHPAAAEVADGRRDHAREPGLAAMVRAVVLGSALRILTVVVGAAAGGAQRAGLRRLHALLRVGKNAGAAGTLERLRVDGRVRRA